VRGHFIGAEGLLIYFFTVDTCEYANLFFFLQKRCLLEDFNKASPKGLNNSGVIIGRSGGHLTSTHLRKILHASLGIMQ